MLYQRDPCRYEQCRALKQLNVTFCVRGVFLFNDFKVYNLVTSMLLGVVECSISHADDSIGELAGRTLGKACADGDFTNNKVIPTKNL